ncbi:class I SAM-dependent methyltransferase [Chitinophaga agrisoli]|uniref:Class I SAM-dependent methyltransferase n=1 Tax=Chitinophaga agrisoli TaxID=2607653 RepID=A0A5B2VJU7_9BACT|nr:class I SAM-dependent methyltransferase [Chitinophaga agrisoli]KAA2238509.1 class I SAM-dependent methyltransferase [Chitinophaga agrisoli]
MTQNLDRSIIAQWLIDNYGFNTYMEIGVEHGHIFFPVKAKRKIAVDPIFRFNWRQKLKMAFKYPQNFNASYFQKESDRFFAKYVTKALRGKPLDICLVDGMHEYAFALRDVENCLQYMPDNGVIIMHDCNPKSREASYTWKEYRDNNYSGDWNGDVWKTIMHLRSTRQDINVFVLDCDHGLGIITKGKQEKPLSFTPAQIEQLTYEEFAANRQEWLNMKPESYFHEYFKVK